MYIRMYGWVCPFVGWGVRGCRGYVEPLLRVLIIVIGYGFGYWVQNRVQSPDPGYWNWQLFLLYCSILVAWLILVLHCSLYFGSESPDMTITRKKGIVMQIWPVNWDNLRTRVAYPVPTSSSASCIIRGTIAPKPGRQTEPSRSLPLYTPY